MGTDTAPQDFTHFANVSPHLNAWTLRVDCNACIASRTATNTHASSVARSGPDTDEGQPHLTTTILKTTSSTAPSGLPADPILDGDNAPEGITTLQSHQHPQHATNNDTIADIAMPPVGMFTTALSNDDGLGLAPPPVDLFDSYFSKATCALDAVGKVLRRNVDKGFPNAKLVDDAANAVKQHTANDDATKTTSKSTASEAPFGLACDQRTGRQQQTISPPQPFRGPSQITSMTALVLIRTTLNNNFATRASKTHAARHGAT